MNFSSLVFIQFSRTFIIFVMNHYFMLAFFCFVSIRFEAYYLIADTWLTYPYYWFNPPAVINGLYNYQVISFGVIWAWLTHKPGYLSGTIHSLTSLDHPALCSVLASWICTWHQLRDSENLFLISHSLYLAFPLSRTLSSSVSLHLLSWALFLSL